ncbi:MAG: hypothetical protein KIT84_17155 [Labilithrix sp.]|nr:hypothetical protein [Labilithrix sp.]MCW5812759.1 hypothetical protein [Labilithrix sp.]
MAATRDPIAMVEACYDLRATEEQWLGNLARLAAPILKVEDVLAYHVEVDPRFVRFGEPVSTRPGGLAMARIRVMRELLERCRSGRANALQRMRGRLYEKVIRKGIVQSADRMLLSEFETYGPRWMYTLGVPRIREILHLVNHHIDGNGVTLLIGPRLKADTVHPAERATYQMLSAHLKAGRATRTRRPESGRAWSTAAGRSSSASTPTGSATSSPIGTRSASPIREV